jgi:hypothetical protein
MSLAVLIRQRGTHEKEGEIINDKDIFLYHESIRKKTIKDMLSDSMTGMK